MTFKERVAAVAIAQAPRFKSVFVDHEYLICSKAFMNPSYYILSSLETNYQHLIGVNTPNLSRQDFFDKCFRGTLTEADFDFIKPNKLPIQVKGAVRNKIRAMPFFTSMMGKDLVVQESFVHNRVHCSLATTDCNITIGFIESGGLAWPRSLMLGDNIDWSQAEPVDLILRRPQGAALFSEMVFGDTEALKEYADKIKDMVDPKLIVSD